MMVRVFSGLVGLDGDSLRQCLGVWSGDVGEVGLWAWALRTKWGRRDLGRRAGRCSECGGQTTDRG